MTDDTQNNQLPQSIETSFRWVSAIAGVCLVIVFTLIQVTSEYRTELGHLEDRSHEIERILTETLASAMEPIDHDNLKLISDEALLADDIQTIAVWSANHQLLYENMKANAKSLDDALLNKRVFTITDSTHGNTELGVVMIEMTTGQTVANLGKTIVSTMVSHGVKFGGLILIIIMVSEAQGHTPNQ